MHSEERVLIGGVVIHGVGSGSDLQWRRSRRKVAGKAFLSFGLSRACRPVPLQMVPCPFCVAVVQSGLIPETWPPFV